MTDRGLSPTEASAAIESALGLHPTRLERMPYGHFNVTYSATLPTNRHLIIRTNRDPNAMRGARHNLPILKRLGLPVPTLLHAADTHLILEKIPGQDLGYELPTMTEPQMTRVAEQVVSFQRFAATLPPADGHGWRPIGEPGRYPSWTAVIDHDLEKNLRLTRDLLPDGAENRLLREAAAHQPRFDAQPPTPFLDDLTTKNVIVHHGELQGIVDFDVICYGDPLYWLGLTRTAVLCHTPQKAFYVDELLRLYGGDPDLVRFYSAIFALDFIAYGRNKDMAPEMLARLLRLVE